MHTEKIINSIRSLAIVNEEELSVLGAHIQTRTLKKGEFFVQTGDICQEIAFVNSGMMRSYYITEEGEDFTYCVCFEDEFMSAYSSYITAKPAIENIQAIVDTELCIIQKSFIEKRSEESHNTTRLMRYFAEQYILDLEHRVFSYQKESARTRYEYMLKNHPKYLSEIPLHYLASYLGITQRHLSRIRKEIAHPH